MTACATGHGAENPPTVLRSASSAATCAEIKFYGVFVLNHRVVLAPDALVDFHTGEKERRCFGREVQGGY